MLALVPTPIGVGPRYQPPPAAVGACVPGSPAHTTRAHVELFANGRVVIVPARIGVRSGCHAHTWTTDPTGVVRSDRRSTLGDLFRVWGRRLAPARLLSFGGRVRVYVAGRRVRVDPRSVELRDGAEIVLEVGPYVPPHETYRFPVH
jgi:hypothetical protein